jgi:hypothetical protein
MLLARTMHSIEIACVGYGARGPIYRVTHAGQVLLEASRCPEFDAARALLTMGITGSVQVWRPGGTFPSMTLDIAKAAKMTVEESATASVRLTRWVPFSIGGGDNLGGLEGEDATLVSTD